MNDDPIPFIIETVRQPVAREREDKPSPGVDLAPHEPALRGLLEDVEEAYREALLDWQSRHSPTKPKQKLEDNWDPGEPVHFDYGADTGVGWDWETHYKRYFYRGPGNPGLSRKRLLLPLTPLDPVYATLRSWWRSTLGKPFRPDFRRAHDGGALTNVAYFNSPARLLLLVAQGLDPRYTPMNCNSVHDRMRNAGPKGAGKSQKKP